MSQIPDTEKNHQDYIDMLLDSCKKPVVVKDENDQESIQLVLDTKKLDYKSQLVSSIGYSRFALTKEFFENLSVDVYNFMSYKRAKVLSDQIMRIVSAYSYSVDAKSSETLRDPTNSQSSLTHMLLRNVAERKITLKEEAKRGFWEAIGGKEKNKATEGY